MTEAGSTGKVEGKGGSNNVAGSQPSTIKLKRKERNEEKPSNRANVKVGDRVKAKFDDSDWLPVNIRRVDDINKSLKKSIRQFEVEKIPNRFFLEFLTYRQS